MKNIFGSHDPNTLEQFADVSSRAVKSALMADGHFGYIMPVGGVAAYDNQASVNGVGFDIGCGNCAILTNVRLEHLRSSVHDLADEIQASISFGIGRTNRAVDAPVDHDLFSRGEWDLIPVGRDNLRDKARAQLGTVGSGNHYVDVFCDEQGRVWVGVHFGSRGLGHTIASGFLSLGQGGAWGDRVGEKEVLLDLDSQMGRDYWALMSLAGEYAYIGREWVTHRVADLLGCKILDTVHNHHNFAWRESHLVDGVPRDLIVVRKGATPAFPGQRGFVGGSMGDNAVILQGATSASQEAALFSTVHGAGRVLSRTAAAGKRDRKTGELKVNKVTGEVINAGLISQDDMDGWLRYAGVVLRGGGRDEAPQAYRRLPEVLAAQGDTIEVLHTLRPVIVVMAGENEFDPYKD